jgi:hypothetical protein
MWNRLAWAYLIAVIVFTTVSAIGIVKPRATGPAFLQKYLSDEIEKWGDILRTTKDTD